MAILPVVIRPMGQKEKTMHLKREGIAYFASLGDKEAVEGQTTNPVKMSRDLKHSNYEAREDPLMGLTNTKVFSTLVIKAVKRTQLLWQSAIRNKRRDSSESPEWLTFFIH